MPDEESLLCHPTDQTSPSLLNGLRAGDGQSWLRLVDLCSPLVYQWCRRSNLSAEDTRDLMQETFLTVSQHLFAFRREKPASIPGLPNALDGLFFSWHDEPFGRRLGTTA